MKKTLFTILFMIPVLLFSQTENTQKKLLIVLSSNGQDQGETKPGYEFDELSQAYLIFKNNGLLVDIASPKGGKVEADKFSREKIYNKNFLADDTAVKKLENTKTTASIDPNDYDAIYIVGGKGAMFDLPFDPALQEIILNLYKREGTVISSVCHGPAAFMNVRDDKGYIIEDVKMTGFSNVEEKLFDSPWVPDFPFLLEEKMISRGVEYEKTDFMLAKVVVSGKFITGQNPYSTARSAEEVVKALGITPVYRKLYNDERSAYFIQDVIGSEKSFKWAEDELQKNKEDYHIPLIANYGYYKILSANNDQAELKKGLTLMELAMPHFFNEKLRLFMAKTYLTMGLQDKAKPILNELVAKNLLKEEAQELLKQVI